MAGRQASQAARSSWYSRPEGRLQDCQRHGLDRIIKRPRKDRIAIVDEPTVVVFPRQDFTELLERPFGRWIGRHVGVENSAAPDLHDHENVEHLKTRGHGCCEITGGDGLGVISHKGRPALAAAMAPLRLSGHVLAHGRNRSPAHG